ncbi:MAG: hypothetical protein H0A75_07095 [Candidatus Methanofishera endochildressiae]|uniref:Uncharacterized protein n=1 Tax=Candidatus Methanofishera endochildressiae TaxID=2738884 RepID=A0A7Z0SE44_9GAMM|nr:hypothetical protein [Candidatus Methanofishera endochildressiae]
MYTSDELSRVSFIVMREMRLPFDLLTVAFGGNFWHGVKFCSLSLREKALI